MPALRVQARQGDIQRAGTAQASARRGMSATGFHPAGASGLGTALAPIPTGLSEHPNALYVPAFSAAIP